jgi:malate/lactate dehydrogenase
MTVPAIVGKGGVKEILEWEIAPDEAAELTVSTNTINEFIQIVHQALGAAF